MNSGVNSGATAASIFSIFTSNFVFFPANSAL
jgi:hypothetical protein